MKNLNHTFKYDLLSIGDILHVEEHSITGMAGEPMRVAYLKLNGKETVSFSQVEQMLETNDRENLAEYLSDLQDENMEAAMNWTI